MSRGRGRSERIIRSTVWIAGELGAVLIDFIESSARADGPRLLHGVMCGVDGAHEDVERVIVTSQLHGAGRIAALQMLGCRLDVFLVRVVHRLTVGEAGNA